MTNSRRKALISTIVRKALMECVATNNGASVSSEEPYEVFHSQRVRAIKEEIVKAGRKLWERQYVDGNGGNITARLSSKYFLCTPTLCSKGDLRIEDLSLVDVKNRRICGDRAHTSEILLHLEIYKAVPNAKAVIHCHPPYATAHAIAGIIPQGNLMPEQEIFVGPVALTPYETPGTIEFARTVLPVVKQHNTILLANHGVVCWADTVTHAEWYVEVVDTYCKTVMIASQLKSPIPEIPPNKIADLLAIKRILGLPDPRLPIESDLVPDSVIEMASAAVNHDLMPGSSKWSEKQIDQLVSTLSVRIWDFIEKVHDPPS